MPIDFLTNGPDEAAWHVILAHGAGAPMDSPFMDHVAQGLARRGLRVLRFEFPYMQKRRADGSKRPPDREPVLRQAWADAFAQAAADASGAGLIVGGKSLGGRIASMMADELGARGLVCLGYPFHPPGKPERLRISHLDRLSTPTLIVQGTRDALGKRDEVERYALSGSVHLAWIEDGDHSLAPRVRSGRTHSQALDEATEHVLRFVDQLHHG